MNPIVALRLPQRGPPRVAEELVARFYAGGILGDGEGTSRLGLGHAAFYSGDYPAS